MMSCCMSVHQMMIRILDPIVYTLRLYIPLYNPLIAMMLETIEGFIKLVWATFLSLKIVTKQCDFMHVTI